MDLMSNPDNIETADWKQIPSTGRRVDWGRTPSKFVPQMCYTSPDIVAAVKARAALIGTEVKKQLDALETSGKEHLFAGVITGSESQMGRDFEADRPGFSTYPEGSTFKEIYAALAQHGSHGWISAEGANVSPTTLPGEANMETYLGRMFNHGAVLTNVFSWGIGGEAMRDNFFRKVTENPECLAAYAKFLRHEPLIENVATGFSSSNLQDEMHRIQKELPAWIQKSGQQAQVMS